MVFEGLNCTATKPIFECPPKVDKVAQSSNMIKFSPQWINKEIIFLVLDEIIMVKKISELCFLEIKQL